MAQQTVFLGTIANDGTGDPLRTAFDKINDNFDELYPLAPTANQKAAMDAATGATSLNPFVTISGSQTLTNKTLTSPVINVGSDATGDMYFRNAGVLTRLPIGTDTQMLRVSGGLPVWQDFPTLDYWKLTGTSVVTTPVISGSGTFNTGKWTFTPNATTEAINVGSMSGSPSAPTNGGLWYDTSTARVIMRANSQNQIIVNTVGGMGGTGNVAYTQSVSQLTGSSNFTYDGTTLMSVPSVTKEGLNVGSIAGNPSAATNGGIWYNSTTGGLRARISASDNYILAGNPTTGDRIGYSSGAANGGMLFSSNLTFNGSKLIVGGTSFSVPGVDITFGASPTINGYGTGEFIIQSNNQMNVRLDTDFTAGASIVLGKTTVTTPSANLRTARVIYPFTASSGTFTYTGLEVAPTYNTTLTYVGTAIGYDFNPTLTNVIGLTNLAFRSTSGQVFLASSPSDVVTSGARLDVRGISAGGTMLILKDPAHVNASISFDIQVGGAEAYIRGGGSVSSIAISPAVRSNVLQVLSLVPLNLRAAGNGADGFLFSALGTWSTTADFIETSAVYVPTTGTTTFNLFNLIPTYNSTGGTHTIRGLYYNPTNTSLTGVTHYAIHATSGQTFLANTSSDVVTANTRFEVWGISGGNVARFADHNGNATLTIKNSSSPKILVADNTDFGYSGVYFTRAFTNSITLNDIVVSSGNTTLFKLATAAHTGGNHRIFDIVPAAYTGLTAGTELVDVAIQLSRTVTFATGALGTQRAMFISAPTYAFVGASVITDASTLWIDAAPLAGTNATITNAWAFNVNTGAVRFGGVTQDDTKTRIAAFDTNGKFYWRAASTLGSIGGSTGATDNSVLRSDGTGGATLQSSGVIIGDTGDITIGTDATTTRRIVAGGSAGNVSLYLKPTGGSGQVILYDYIENNFFAVSTSDITGSTTGSFYLQSSTALTNSIQSVLRIVHITSGTPANGIGTGISFETETTSGNQETGALIQAVVTDVTAGSEDFDLALSVMAAGASAAEKLRLTSDGRLYGKSLHNNAGSVAGTSNQHIASGTYTPTTYNDANVDSSSGAICQWIRVGNVVTVSGRVSINSTASGADTRIGISLPIASAFGAAEQCGGTAAAPSTSAIENGAIYADVVNARATLSYWGTAMTSDHALYFTFTYLIV